MVQPIPGQRWRVYHSLDLSVSHEPWLSPHLSFKLVIWSATGFLIFICITLNNRVAILESKQEVILMEAYSVKHRQNCSFVIDQNRLTLSLVKGILHIEITQPSNPLQLYFLSASELPPHLATFFNSPQHLYNQIVKHPENVKPTGPILQLTVQVLDIQRTLTLELDSVWLAPEDLAKRAIKHLKLDSDRIMKETRRFKMKMESSIQDRSAVLSSLQGKKKSIEVEMLELERRKEELGEKKQKLQSFLVEADKAVAAKQQKLF